MSTGLARPDRQTQPESHADGVAYFADFPDFDSGSTRYWSGPTIANLSSYWTFASASFTDLGSPETSLFRSGQAAYSLPTGSSGH